MKRLAVVYRRAMRDHECASCVCALLGPNGQQLVSFASAPPVEEAGGPGRTNPRYPTRPKDIPLENLEERL